MHTSFEFNIFLYIWTIFGTFLSVSSFPPHSLVYVSVVMAPKRKSAPSRNPFHFWASSSSDPTPSSIQLCDEQARKDFLENFSRWGVHSERQVILSDFSDIDLPTIIHSWGWESLYDVLVTYPFVLIQEFYSNMHGFDYSVPHFITCVWGTRIVVTPKIVSDVLHVPRVEFPNYPDCERLRIVSKDEMISAFCERLTNWGDHQFTPC